MFRIILHDGTLFLDLKQVHAQSFPLGCDVTKA